VPSREFLTHSAEETVARGREIAAGLKPPALILLSGELGAGKTTLTKGIASGLGAATEEEVTSPTFTLVHRYERQKDRAHEPIRLDPASPEASAVPNAPVYHVDLYRIGDFRDLETLGLEDVLSEHAIVIVEWPHKLSIRTDRPVIRIHLEHVSEDDRRIVIADNG
jgi:tRNA threonylcarbamoyladenosine biosynthesis protein TsaE